MRWVLHALLAASILGSATARAADVTASKQACIDANEKGQIAQRAGHFREARAALVSCASDTCPSIVRSDCARILDEVAASMPAIVVDARDRAGAETTEVSLSVDGAPLLSSLGGTEVELDPGPHVLRFQAKDGAVREVRVVLKVHDRQRRVEVRFADNDPSGSAIDRSTSRVPLAGWVLGGVAAAGLVSFATLAAVGYGNEKSLASSCAPNCASSAVSPVKLYYDASDVALGVGVAAAAATALVVWLRGPAQPVRTGWHFGVAPTASGARIAFGVPW